MEHDSLSTSTRSSTKMFPEMFISTENEVSYFSHLSSDSYGHFVSLTSEPTRTNLNPVLKTSQFSSYNVQNARRFIVTIVIWADDNLIT